MKIKKRITKLLAATFVATLLSTSVLAAPVTVDIPSKPDQGHYLDLAEILTTNTCNEIESVNQQLGEVASIYVVTVKSTGSMDENEFAKEIYSSWELGGKEKQNAALFLISLGENSAYGETYYSIIGSGIKTGFTGTSLATLLETQVEPTFKNGDYNTPTQKFIESVNSTILTNAGLAPEVSPESTSKTEEKKEEGSFFASLMSVISTILMIILIIFVVAIVALILLAVRANNIKKKKRAQRAAIEAKRLAEMQQNQHMQQQEVEPFLGDFTDINS